MQHFNENNLLMADFFSEPATVGEKHLSFFLRGTQYAVASGEVSEVSPMLPLAPLPRSSEALAGVVNLRGKIVTIINLLKICNEPASPISLDGKLIFMRDKNGLYGFAVERLGEFVAVRSELIEPVYELPYLRGKITFSSATLNLLSTNWILAALQKRDG